MGAPVTDRAQRFLAYVHSRGSSLTTQGQFVMRDAKNG
jgi:hypothetical protein